MSGYLQINREILNSTVWVGTDSDTKTLWFFLLLAADMRTGIVPHTLPAISRDTGICREKVDSVLQRFLSPDPDSRSKEFDGRRIELVDKDNPNGGILLLNYAAYKAKHQMMSATRVQRFRSKQCNVTSVTETLHDDFSDNVTLRNVTVTKEKEKEKEKKKEGIPLPPYSEPEPDLTITIGAIPSPSGRKEAATIQARVAAECHDASVEVDAAVERLNAAQKKKLGIPGSLDPTDHRVRRDALKGLKWAAQIDQKDPGKILALSWITYIKDREDQKKAVSFEWFVKEISIYYGKYKKNGFGD
jgi:hypothetical protein